MDLFVILPSTGHVCPIRNEFAFQMHVSFGQSAWSGSSFWFFDFDFLIFTFYSRESLFLTHTFSRNTLNFACPLFYGLHCACSTNRRCTPTRYGLPCAHVSKRTYLQHQAHCFDFQHIWGPSKRWKLISCCGVWNRGDNAYVSKVQRMKTRNPSFYTHLLVGTASCITRAISAVVHHSNNTNIERGKRKEEREKKLSQVSSGATWFLLPWHIIYIYLWKVITIKQLWS